MFRKCWNFIRSSRRRKIVAAVATASLVFAGAALAYYLLEVNVSTPVSGQLGTPGSTTQNVTAEATFPTNLAPCGNSCTDPLVNTGIIDVQVGNTNSQEVNVSTVTIPPPSQWTITQTPDGRAAGPCDPAWFRVDANTVTLPVIVPPQSQKHVGDFPVTFIDDGNPDQNGCAGASISFTATAN